MTNKLAFDDFPAFYENDNRRNRGFNPISKPFLEIKFGVLLPASLVKDKHILDLGSCYGAAGQWVLFNGASSYTGVEVQKNYAEQSQQLLSHWSERVTIIQQDVRSYLNETSADVFDVVIVAGMLYHFIDTKGIIDAVCRLSKESVIVETNFPLSMRSGNLNTKLAITEYVNDQEVNLAEGNQSMLGLSATSSLPALDIFFGLNGFNKHQDKLSFPLTPDTVIYDESVLGNTDLQIRFAVHYFRDSNSKPLTTLENNLPQQLGKKRAWENDLIAKNRTESYQQQAELLARKNTIGQWRFNASIAQQFQQIAQREIPDYSRVINLCVQIIGKSKQVQPKIIDVGSALGETLRQLHHKGYTSLYGVEASADMLEKSFNQATLIHSEQFPEQHAPFDYVINNWTLHFIEERVAYLQAIKRSLSPGGTLILTDKVSTSALTHELYYDMKRANGLSESEIKQKQQQIAGVLVTYPLTWYIETLNDLGFKQIEVINANPAFVTFMAINP